MPFKLSQSERILLTRRRVGLTQAQAARKLKMQLHIYARVENGKITNHPDLIKLRPWFEGPFEAKHHERCLIMRQRCGKTQVQVAKDLKRSRYWINMMELGKVSCDDLLWYWEQ